MSRNNNHNRKCQIFNWPILNCLEKKRQNVDSNVLTDNIPNLQTIASTKLLLRNSYGSFKEHLEYGDIKSYSWLDTNQMLSYVMTKDHSKNNAEKLHTLIYENVFKEMNNSENIVTFTREEILLTSPKEKKIQHQET